MDLLKIYRQLEPVDIEEFSQSFADAKENAFRLEMLDQYTVPGEFEHFQNYLAGKTVPNDFNIDWLELIKKCRANGVHFQRVRFARSPFSQYLKFEVSWGYTRSIKAGEDIKVITSEDLPEFSQKVPILKDFWIFDSSKCFILEYDIIGQFLGINKVPNEYIESYSQLAKELTNTSEPIANSGLWEYSC